MANKVLKVAAMAASYNRIKKTTAFLESVTTQVLPAEYSLDVFLLDDQSPDGTADYVREHFPQVNLIIGTGRLYWAGGMRQLWSKVREHADYDFYILFNDDVKLFEGAVARLLEAYKLSPNKNNVVVGSVKNFEHTGITYGGRKLLNGYNGDAVWVEPDDNKLLECDLGNANIMLVDKGTVEKIGILSDRYVHGIADYDYTLNAKRHGSKVWVAPGYYGVCEFDHGNSWLSPGHTLKERIAFLHSPKGLESKGYLRYIRKFFPLYYPEAFFKLWMKTLFPGIWDKYKKSIP